MKHDFEITGYSAYGPRHTRPRPGVYHLPGVLPVRNANGEEEFVSTVALLGQEKLTPAILASITWLYEEQKREVCRWVHTRSPRNKKLQEAANAIRSVPDGSEGKP